MNILYIAPYRQKTMDGILSLFILINLIKSSNNVTARPIFLDNHQSMDLNDPVIDKVENSVYDYYDIVIQLIDVNQAIKINHNHKKNIIIPLLNNQILSSDNIKKLSEFDKVLVDTKYKYNILSSYDKKLSSKLITYDFAIPISINSNTIGTFNLGHLSHSKKIYCIVNNQNITDIYNLCCAFIKNTLYHEYSLLIFMTNVDNNIKSTIDNLIAKAYKEYEIQYSINRILLIPIDSALDHLITAHHTGSIFVDIENNIINNKLAEFMNKQIINFNSEDYRFEMYNNNIIKRDGYLSLEPKSLNNKIYKLMNSNSIEPPIPFKKTNITKLI